MPFSNTTHKVPGAKKTKTTTAAEWTNIYQEWIKKAAESYPDANIKCERSATPAANFVKGIVGSLTDSDFAIADLTGNKPNVYYELGIRHALRTGTIIITQHRNALPSDLQTYYCLEYSYSGAHYEYKRDFLIFKKAVHALIETILTQNFASDSPVSDFLGYTNYLFAKEWTRERDELIAQLEEFIALQERYTANMENVIAKKSIPELDVFELNLCLSKFYDNQWKLLRSSLIRTLKNIMFFYRNIVITFDELFRKIDEIDATNLVRLNKMLSEWRLSDTRFKANVLEIKKLKPPARKA